MGRGFRVSVFITAVLSLALVVTVAPPAAQVAEALNSGFVTAEGGQFVLNGSTFRFVSTNAYFLLDSVNYGSLDHTRDMLQLSNDLGFTVLRMWAFMDGTGSTGGFQPSPGVYDETTARQLDWILDQADQAGVRVILTLTNYWSDYGGMPWYVSQCVHPGASVNLFYTDACSQQYFKQWVQFLVTRVNFYNKRAYRDDPTIFAWELANEPRSDDSTGEKVRAWVSDIAAYIKSLDPNHMVDTGEEGFDTTFTGYGDVNTVYNRQTYMFNGGIGTSFTNNTQDPNIDFASAHLYPEYWNFSFGAGNNWIADHITIAAGLGKPLVLGEFGVSSGAVRAEADRAAILKEWLDTSEANQGGGALVWELICSQVCSNHGGSFASYYPPATQISDIFASAAALANTTTGTPPPPSTDPILTALSPSGVVQGRSDFTLTVTGSNFDTSTRVLWNGVARLTTFVSASQVKAVVTAADVTTVSTADVTIWNSSGAVSNSLQFAISQIKTTTDCAGQYLAQYFANTTLSEPMVFNECDMAPLVHDWGSGSPGSTVPNDGFSARWTGAFPFAKKLYRFTATSDDGVRVYLDGAKIIDGWSDHAATKYTKRLNVSAGQHAVKVEYYENTGSATISVGW